MWPFNGSDARWRTVLSGFVAEPVVDLILAGRDDALTPRLRNVAILFSNIGDAQALGTLQPVAAMKLFEDIFLATDDSVRRHHGLLDKYVGDGAMALWNVPSEHPDYQACACLAALDVVEAIAALSKAAGLAAPPPMRIGITSGTAIVGLLQKGRRREYSAMGDEVNLASRLESANKFFGTQILINENLYRGAIDKIVGRSLGRIRVIGRDAPIQVFEVMAKKGQLSDKWNEALPAYLKGLDAFFNRKYSDAVTCFENATRIIPNDGPSQLYLMASRDYTMTPPEANWDGVMTLTTP